MKKTPPTERELEALKILWDRGEATVRELWEAMSASGEPSPYTTVLSLLQVMTKKGLVSHRREGKAHVYQPSIERNRAFQSLATGFLDRVFDGAVDEYLVHALESRKLKNTELDQLESMIADARKRSGNKGDSK
jgi:BlaI family penicillinase repressor